MPLQSDRAFVVFQCGGTLAALPLEAVDKIAPMAELARPPGLPHPIEGLLNFGGNAIPVLRLDHLLGLAGKTPGLYSMLILPKPNELAPPLAMLVDRVSHILHVSEDKLLPVATEDSVNACVQAVIQAQEQMIHVLSPARILLEKEREMLTRLAEHEQNRLADWEAAIQ